MPTFNFKYRVETGDDNAQFLQGQKGDHDPCFVVGKQVILNINDQMCMSTYPVNIELCQSEFPELGQWNAVASHIVI